MSKKIVDRVIAGLALSATVYFSVVGYNLYGQSVEQKNNITEECNYLLYTWKKPQLNVCSATVALDCAEIVRESTTFQRTCTSSTICSELAKVESGFREACALSPDPGNDSLLALIEKERDQLLRKDGSYFVCESWDCYPIRQCYKEDCVPCGKAVIRKSDCIFLFPKHFWRFRR